MQLTRTTVRLQPPIKKAAEIKALELNISFQTLLNQALELYLRLESNKKAKKIVFNTKDIGFSLDNLTREDIYAD